MNQPMQRDRTGSRPGRHRRAGGFSLIEVLLVTSMMMTVVATVAVGMRSGYTANEEINRRAVLTSLSGELMDRLFRIDFGQPGGVAPSGDQLTELFDDDDSFGTATLCQLAVAPGGPGYLFQLENFPYNGTWEVRVTSDLNNDGDDGDPHEGRPDLYRIDILYDGLLVLETMRSAPIG